ncbi:DUF5683 domain-containing protein [Niabella insulamsoli]|uniref:DUF5683 domain-containing protein n=1 Tax=Niabella insulamsoli TaxID=3144874 RepID=UPI0031FDF491
MRFFTKLFFAAFFGWLMYANEAQAQEVDTALAKQILATQDTTVKPTISNPAFEETDSSKLRDPNARIPRVAALRSAIIPGWGQIYNRKIWKVPIIYAALGVTGGIFINNLTWYKRTKYAYTVAYNITQGKDEIGSDSYNKVNDDLKRVFFEGSQGVQPEYLRTNRDYFRKNLDYAAIYFVIAWALNVVEATVDAHLSSFDVSPDLSFKMQPGYSQLAGTAGVSFVLQIK